MKAEKKQFSNRMGAAVLLLALACVNGYAQEITEDVPEGLEFLWSEETGSDLEADTTLSDEEKEAIEFNQNYLWGNFVYNEEGNKIIQISTDYLSKENEGTPGSNLIEAFGKNDGTKTNAWLNNAHKSFILNISGCCARYFQIQSGDDENGRTEDRPPGTQDEEAASHGAHDPDDGKERGRDHGAGDRRAGRRKPRHLLRALQGRL